MTSSDLTEAARLIERQIVYPAARFAIADEGFPDEASLMGTRDGLLNLAHAVVKLVSEADAGRGWEDDGRFAWGDGIKVAMHQIPSFQSVFLVGAYVFRDHAEFMAELRKWFDPEIAASLTVDPDFAEPSQRRMPEPESGTSPEDES